MPEEDAPTMTGTPGDPHVDDVADGDDTTTAQAGPPAPLPNDEPGEHDADDRTVQQKVSAPAGRRAPPPPPSGPPSPVTQKGPATLGAPVTPSPSTQPSSLPPSPPSQAGAGVSVSISTTRAGSATAEMEEIELEEVEDIEDSITAMAPRVSVKLPGFNIPGSVKISTAEDDDLADETEVRTLAGNLPLEMLANLRAGPPPPPPRPAAGVPASDGDRVAAPSTEPEGEDENDDDGVTTEAPAPRVGSGSDLAASVGILPKSSGPTTEPEPSPSTQPGSSDPVPTTRPRIAIGLAADSVDEPPTRPGVESAEHPTRPGVEGAEAPTLRGLGDAPTSARKPKPKDDDGYANDADDEESVTARGRVVDEPYEDESVTTQANAVSERIVSDALAKMAAPHGAQGPTDAMLDDATDGTTQKVRKARKALDSSPADSESESITTQAPGPLTNILRVIASESNPNIAASGIPRPLEDDDEPPENRTAVMANAPLKRIVDELETANTIMASGSMPVIRPTGPPLTLPLGSGGRSSAAPQLAPSSESGLRVARPLPPSEHASLGALGVDVRPSGIARTAGAMGDGANGSSDPRGPVGPGPAAMAAFHQSQPSLHDIDLGKGPRYGLLVAIVGVVSFVVPVTLFVVLRGHPETLTQAVPAEASSERVTFDNPTRGKLDKKAASAASASASASAAAFASTHRPPASPPRPPFNRR